MAKSSERGTTIRRGEAWQKMPTPTPPNGATMAHKIELTQGKTALVDDCDYDRISKHKWCVMKDNRGKFRAVRNTGMFPWGRMVYMAREIMNPPDGMKVDHIREQNTLDNRRSNLRICTNAQNSYNRGKNKNNTSGFKGVSLFAGKWRALIAINGKLIHLGYYSTAEQAAKAYDAKAKELHGEFARTNF
jgi:hypothetical protein